MWKLIVVFSILVASYRAERYQEAAPQSPAAALAVAPGSLTATPPLFNPGSGTYSSGTVVNLSTVPTSCDPYIFWSSVHNPPTTGDNNTTSFNVISSATIFAKVIGCPFASDSTVSNASYVVGTGTNIFNCSSFTAGTTAHSCAASSSNNTLNNGNFKFNGGHGSVTGSSQLQLAPANTSHTSLNALYTTPVNVQAFSTTYTFIPSGNTIGFMFQNTNNQPGFQGLSYAAGAGCEGGWFQAKNVGVGAQSPNLVFAVGMDGFNNLDPNHAGPGPNGFTFSNTQAFQATQDPCSPNDGDPNYYPTSRLSTSPVSLNSPSNTPNTTTGHVYSVTIVYDGTNLTESMFDVTGGGACPGASCYTHTWTAINIPSIVGSNTALMGLTASTISAGNVGAVLFNSWSYTVLPAPPTPALATYTNDASNNLVTTVAATPTFSPAQGTYTSAQTVTISDTSAGSYICETASATPPAVYPYPDNEGNCAAGTKYTGPITVSSTQTIYAAAGFTYGGLPSNQTTSAYTIGSVGPAGVLAASRSTDWTKAGVTNSLGTYTGIPNYTTQCGSTIPAQGTSGSPVNPATIIATITACSGTGQFVLFGTGTFWFSGAIYLHGVHDVEIRGNGPTNTQFNFTASSGCLNGNGSCLIGDTTTSGNYAGGPGPVANWTGGYTQGSTTINLSDLSQITATTSQTNPTIIILDQCDTGLSGAPCSGSNADNGNFWQCETNLLAPPNGTQAGCTYGGPSNAARPGRGQTEYMEAVSCSPACGTSGAGTVTLDAPLEYPNWTSGNTPQAWFINPASHIGFRGFTIHAANLAYGTVNAGIGLTGISYGWITNVVFDSLSNNTIQVAQAANHLQIENNYIYDSGQSAGPNDDSAINFYGGHSLIDNNLIQNSQIAMIRNGPAAGNVWAYNFSVNQNTLGGTLGSCFDGHANGESYDLFEGNVCTKVDFDQAHGDEDANTYYRNFFYGWESCSNGMGSGTFPYPANSPSCITATSKGANLYSFGNVYPMRYENIVANVLGTPGPTLAGRIFTNAEWFFSGNGYVYNTGSGNTTSPPGSFGGPLPIDSLAQSTALMWGNWEAFAGTTLWNTSDVPTTAPVYPNAIPTACVSGGSCPASFYLASRPFWWAGTIAFPAIGPDVAGGNVGQCGGTVNTPGQYKYVPATNASQCAGQGLNTAWNGQVNAIPAMIYYFQLGGLPDGTGPRLTGFDAAVGY